MSELEKINQFLNQKHIAVAGVSRSGNNIGNSIFSELKGKEYTTVPILLEFGLYPYFIFKTPFGKFMLTCFIIIISFTLYFVYNHILLDTQDQD